jgi:hypothetical protein
MTASVKRVSQQTMVEGEKKERKEKKKKER